MSYSNAPKTELSISSGHTKDAGKFLFSTDGNYLLSLWNGWILWDMNTGGQIWQFENKVDDGYTAKFTYALLERLKCQADGGQKDFKITVSELKAFLEDRVPTLTEKYKGTAQYPTGYNRGQDFPIVICK